MVNYAFKYNQQLPFIRCRYCRHHYQDEPKPAIAIARASRNFVFMLRMAVARATVATPGEW